MDKDTPEMNTSEFMALSGIVIFIVFVVGVIIAMMTKGELDE